MPDIVLAPLRGVTVRAFRETFAAQLAEAGFTEAVTPFITATGGYDPLKDRELCGSDAVHGTQDGILVTPQFIGKDPSALRYSLGRVKAAGYATADLNCGCPFPMVRNKGRGSGILRTPDVLRRMLETGCDVMGPGKFSVKARLGVERTDELPALMSVINEFPLRHLTVHARTAKQMYEGACDRAAFAAVAASARMKVVYNGDVGFSFGKSPAEGGPVMIGRGFVRALGERDDIGELMERYLERSMKDFGGSEHAVLGRLKELMSYWKDLPSWRRRWQVAKLARTTAEIRGVISVRGSGR